jgi:aliphatic sulfonates family ABC transporter substrate-binding protein
MRSDALKGRPQFGEEAPESSKRGPEVHMRNHSRREVLQALAGAALGTAAFQSTSTPVRAADTVRIGWQPTLNGARYFVAMHEGLFAKNGLNVQPIKFTSGPAYFSAFGSKSIDVGFMGTPPAVVGIAQGVPMKIFAIENFAPGSEALIARKGSGIDSLKAMKGKKIATKRGTSGDYALQTGLAKAGLSLSDITFIDLDVSALMPAFNRGDIDAGWYWEPWQGQMVDAGGEQIATDGQIGVAGGIVWVAHSEWLASNADAVARLLHAIDEATAVISKDPQKAASYIVADLGVTQDLAMRVLTKEAFWPTMRQSWEPGYSLSINPAALKSNKGLMDALVRQAEFQKREGVLKTVPDFMQAIDTHFVAAFVGAKG